DRLPVLVGGVEGAADVQDAGDVDQYADRADPVLDVPDRPIDGGRVADVELDDGAAELLGQGVEAGGGAIGGGRPQAGRAEGGGGGAADALSRAGDQCDGHQ